MQEHLELDGVIDRLDQVVGESRQSLPWRLDDVDCGIGGPWGVGRDGLQQAASACPGNKVVARAVDIGGIGRASESVQRPDQSAREIRVRLAICDPAAELACFGAQGQCPDAIVGCLEQTASASLSTAACMHVHAVHRAWTAWFSPADRTTS